MLLLTLSKTKYQTSALGALTLYKLNITFDIMSHCLSILNVCISRAIVTVLVLFLPEIAMGNV